MVIKSSKALLIIYTLSKLRSLARMQLPTALQVSMQERNITIECELTMRLRPLHIAVRRTPPFFPISPPNHRDLQSPPLHPAQSVFPGLTTLTMRPVSRFNASKADQAHIRKLQRQEPM